MHRIILIIICGFLLSPALCFGFNLVDYSPLLSHFEVNTTEEIILVFDESIDPATVLPANVYLEPRDGGAAVDATLSLATTNMADDTVVLTTTDLLPFGLPLRIVITGNLKSVGTGSFSGYFPDGDWFVPNVPTDLDRPVWDPANFTGVFVNSNVLLGFNPIDPEGTDPERPWEIPGIAATEAWKIHTGRPEIIIAAVDNGLSKYDDEDLLDRYFINAGELPPPKLGTQTCWNYDCNGDGRFSVSDYFNDPQFAGKVSIDPMTLIETYSDGIDDDGNGYVDDICGYDFFRDTNTALGVNEFREGTHATLSGKAACATAGNGYGDKPGICPNCTFLPMRVSDAVIADLDLMAEGARYATEMGAKVLMVALGAVDYSEEAQQVFADAYEQDVITIAASGDELGYHHLYPAAGEDMVSVHAVLPIPAVEILGPLNLGIVGFLESYCTNYGAHTTITVSTGACTSEAVGNGAGLAGLIYSYGLERGYDLTAGEVIQLMNMGADDVASHCLTLTPGGCKPGWDQHWGYGRVNAYKSLKMLGWPEMGIPEQIPPDVRITSPLWWSNIDPFTHPVLTVEGEIYARGRQIQYEVQFAKGVEPDDNEFAVVGSGSGEQIDDVLASIYLWDFVTEEEVRRRPEHHDAFTVTLRLQAWYEGTDGKRVLGEARKAFALFTDDDKNTGLMEGFPIHIGSSGESSPVLYDLDGDPDGRPEIILATSNGRIEVFKHLPGKGAGTWEMAAGFPVVLPNDRYYPDGMIGAPAVGSLFGDGIPYIVVATFMGHVYAIQPSGNSHPNGPFVDGFPVSAYERDNDTPLSYGHGRSFLASPALADLDGDGTTLEIIAASYDQYVYAWKPTDEDKDGTADMVSGWPVLAKSDPGVVPGYKECDYPLTAQILGSPAVAVLDPDHPDPSVSEMPAVVVPTGEVCSGGLFLTSRVYAIYHNGYDHPDGPFLPGWPAMVTDPFGDEIPIPPLTIGATSSPAIYRNEKEGKTIIGVGTFFWFPIMLVYQDGKITPNQLLSSGMNMSVSANGSFGIMDDTDKPYYFFPTAGFLNNTDDSFLLESFNISGWKVGWWGDLAFRKRLDDINFFVNPTIADLDNDGYAEVISGSSGYILHAWDIDGDKPEGWPKFTQNFLIGSATIGDIDVDGLTDVVVFSHEGNLFAWKTLGKACRGTGINAEWWSFHHDEHNTGTYGVDTIPPGVVRDLLVESTDEPDKFRISFTATGDDWYCGLAAIFDVRYSTTASADLTKPAVFESSLAVEAPTPQEAGSKVSFIVEAPGAKNFAVRAVDQDGHIGLISPPASISNPGDDDDSEDDDDADSDDDDDDDEACCG